MSEHNQKVEPLRFEPAAVSVADAEGDASHILGRHRWKLPLAASVLATLAVLVFFWLPSQVNRDAVRAAVAEGTPTRPRTSSVEVAPWLGAQLARQRKAAQDILANLLEEQFALEELQVDRWAAEGFAAAQAEASAGDELYRQQLFQEASEKYQAGLDAMMAVSEQVAPLFAETLQTGEGHLTDGQAAPAVQALELAVILRPDSPEANLALDRAHKLPALLELMSQADAAVETGDLDAAKELLQQARTLDPIHPRAKSQLETVQGNILRRDFNRAMSAGYQALDEKRHDDAEQRFLEARKILPGAPEAETALVQTRTERTQMQIDDLAQQAEAAGSQENWQQAVDAYQAILDTDSSVVFARAGLIQAQTRARLNESLNHAIEKPERLNDENIYRDTLALYRQAQGLEHQGPSLRKQLQDLEELLRLAIIPVPVLLRSDERTEVTVLKVGQLGTFRNRQLNLKPGTYTAVGVRKGYRDVRRQFTVAHSGDSPVVEISCTERI